PRVSLQALAQQPACPQPLAVCPHRRCSDLARPIQAWAAAATPARNGFETGPPPPDAPEARAGPAAAAGQQEVAEVAEAGGRCRRSEEHTELQSRENLVCRLLLEKKKTKHQV